MKRNSNKGVIGAVLIGIGCTLTAAGLALVIPACASWSAEWLDQVFRRGRDRVGDAASTIGDLAGRAQQQLQHHAGEAAKKARGATAVAAGALESAARHVREQVS